MKTEFVFTGFLSLDFNSKLLFILHSTDHLLHLYSYIIAALNNDKNKDSRVQQINKILASQIFAEWTLFPNKSIKDLWKRE